MEATIPTLETSQLFRSLECSRLVSDDLVREPGNSSPRKWPEGGLQRWDLVSNVPGPMVSKYIV